MPVALAILWAKLAITENGAVRFHPLICHMIDVAQVARVMWLEVLPGAARDAIRQCFGMDQHSASAWVALLAALHDLGKASPAFQLHRSLDRQPPILARIRETLERTRFPLPAKPKFVHHGTITASELPSILREQFAVGDESASRLAAVVGGHHGIFPTSSQIRDCEDSKDVVGGQAWSEARSNLAKVVADLLGASGGERIRIDNSTAMVLAGLVSVADWIGSAEEFFSYARRELGQVSAFDLEDYARRSEDGARQALAKLRWTGWTPAPGEHAFSELFPNIRTPNSLQKAVIGVADRIQEPALLIVEAPMGEGKTEAAMFLADRFALRLGQRGYYFALPTQATSNQMFTRVRDFLQGSYSGGIVNLQLLHGHAALSAEFETLRRRADLLPVCTYDEDDGPPDRHSGVVAAEWFTYRKRGLLAPFGVGTVDQALLAVLQTRHVFVRLFGLAHKVVIIDEVHAYDAYMTTLLERLLEWLGALGSSVVLLSATLPKKRRESLGAAYLKALNSGATAAIPDGQDYPRVAWISRSLSDVRHVEASQPKSISLDWIDGAVPGDGARFELGERLAKALADGGCAAVICNTVARAQEVYCALRPHFPDLGDDVHPELDLFHARYLYKDRDTREKRAFVRFGKPGAKVDLGEGGVREVRRPNRAVLVATQVIEQSLDLDFDLIVTDHAPVDLILQRAGRLHRHERERPAGLRTARVWICRPPVRDDGPSFGKADTSVYDEHILLRSWLALKDRTSITIPKEVEDLIETVYDEREPPSELPEGIRQRWKEGRKEHERVAEFEREEAKDRWLKAPSYRGQLWRFTGDPREEDAPDFHQAHQALTRLSEPSVSVVCVSKGEALDPEKAPRSDEAKKFLMRSVQISDKRILGHLMKMAVPPPWSRSPLLRHHRLIVLGDNSAATFGRYVLRLDGTLGVVIEDGGAKEINR